MKNASVAFIIALTMVNVVVLFWNWNKNVQSAPKLEAEELTIRHKDGSKIFFGSNAQHLQMAFEDKLGKKQLSLEGGEEPSITLYNDKGVAIVNLTVSKDKTGAFLSNDKGSVVGSWTLLEDGAAGFGLADPTGAASSILRGGSSPGLSLYTDQDTPNAVFGIIEKVPHLLISGQEGEEGVLIHGGLPTSLMLMNENGELMVLISKKGVFKGKDKSEAQTPAKKPKFFTYEQDQRRLFPDQKSAR